VFVSETSFGEGSLAIKIDVACRVCPMARTVLAQALRTLVSVQAPGVELEPMT
jgi:hypothetical protein